ncbi:hypothetical protein GBA52_024492 [Prunus armeniaca]|nr:hypothetical protein GBA52_024492 [Prunus armeniaca]
MPLSLSLLLLSRWRISPLNGGNWLPLPHGTTTTGSVNKGEDGFYDNAQGDVDNVADLLPETFDLEAGEDFSSLEAQFEEFLQLSQTESKNGMNNYSKRLETSTAVLKNLKSLEDKRSPVEQRRYAEKPAKHVSPKCSPRFIQQPR